MNTKKIKVLMVVEQCNPKWASVPLVAFKLYDEVSKLANVTLITHERNKFGLEPVRNERNIHYIAQNKYLTKYYALTDRLVNRGAINWPLYHLLNYPIYFSFNRSVYSQFKDSVLAGDYDIVHALTPMMPRYPVKLINACDKVPFILGPVNGGVPFPKGFEETARKEFVHFNFLRFFGRHLIPGYKKTYTKADRILVGSTFTKGMLKETFDLRNERLSLFFENGIENNFVSQQKQFAKDTLKILFVGRLVPYKGADMVLTAIMSMSEVLKSKIELTIVGDGPERVELEKQSKSLKLSKPVIFTGWVEQKDTLKFYQEADLFCFPSIREFGGAVVLEAMACGLPCLVVDNGGIGEYVTDDTGFKIKPNSREFVVTSIADILAKIIKREINLENKSKKSIARVSEFHWNKKAIEINKIYTEILQN